MSTLAYPSPDFPGLPSVALDVPEGWVPAYAPNTTLAARLPREAGFAPNVVVSIEQAGPGASVEQSLQQIAAMASSRGGGTSEPYAAELGGRSFVGCDASWPDAELETVLQANLFHFVTPEREGAAVYVVQITGAVGGPTAEQDYELIREVISSVRVAPWAAAGAGA